MIEENVLTEKSNGEMIGHIVNNLSFKDLVPVILMDQSYGMFFYLDYEKEKPSELKIQSYQKVVHTEKHNIVVAITRDQMSDMKIKDLDSVDLLYNVLLNECQQYMTKAFISHLKELAEITYRKSFSKFDKMFSFIYDLFKKKYIKTIKITDNKQLLLKILTECNKITAKSRYGMGDYIVCGAQTYTLLSENEYFIKNITNHITPYNSGDMYLAGQLLGNISVYVDPYMKWAYTTVYVGRKIKENQPGINFMFNKNGMTLVDLIFNTRRR